MERDGVRISVPSTIKSLARLAYEACSPFQWVKQGLVVSATANLYDRSGAKLKELYTTYARPVRGLLPAAKRLIPLFPAAIEMVHHHCNSTEDYGKHKLRWEIDEIISETYMGSAGGCNSPEMKQVEEEDGITYIKNPNGKKFDVVLPAIEQFRKFMTSGKRPFVSFRYSIKEENVFMDSLDDMLKKLQKGRLFVIPNFITILLEMSIGSTRYSELGGSIGIGRSWSYGGMDGLLEMLGVLGREDDFVLNEGDVVKIDQSLCDILINIFWSSRLIYFDPKHPDYSKVRDTLQLLIEEFTQKVTHIVFELWAIIVGGVPSGALHTSHMDSWILLFLFFLFCLDIAHTHPEMDEEIQIALLTKMIAIVVYGDDNWYFLKKGRMADLLNAREFAKWLKIHWGIEMRDVRVGHNLVSVPRNGFFEVKGGIYLRHYCVKNPLVGEGQSRYVPYRPMKEVVLKTVYGREPTPRDGINLILSILGHVYGTYGSNEYSYSWLLHLYTVLISVYEIDRKTILTAIERVERDVTRKLRQVDLPVKALLEGFPTLAYLRERNRYVRHKHEFEAIRDTVSCVRGSDE